MTYRNGLPRGRREECFKRDAWKCVNCGVSKYDMPLEIDHKIPISRGGTDDLSNLQTLCYKCNRNKGNGIVTNHLKSNLEGCVNCGISEQHDQMFGGSLCATCYTEFDRPDLIHKKGSLNHSCSGVKYNDGFSDETLRCPDCRFTYNHPILVQVFKGKESISIDSRDEIIRTPYENHDRGVKIKIVFRCEAGHLWYKWFEFHKGNTEERNEMIGETNDDFKVIWRD